MIYLVTGKPGAGKSFHCIRVALECLDSGRWLATNIELHEGWALTFARSNQMRRLAPKRVAVKAADFERRTYVTHSLDELTRLRLPPCGKCNNCSRGKQCQTEDRGRMLLDEAHNWLNSRTWDQDEDGAELTRAQAVEKRLKIVRFFSQHRKLGWTIYLVTQDDANLDTQVRRNFEYHTHLKNLRRFKVLGILPIVPVNVFVALTTWHDSDKSKVGSSMYLLNKKLAGCYDTTATSHGLDWDDPSAIWLGRPAGAGSAAGEARSDPPASAPNRGLPAATLAALMSGDESDPAVRAFIDGPAKRFGRRRSAVRAPGLSPSADRPEPSSPGFSHLRPSAVLAPASSEGSALREVPPSAGSLVSLADAVAVPVPPAALASPATGPAESRASQLATDPVGARARPAAIDLQTTNGPELATPTRSPSTTALPRVQGSPPE